MLGTMADDKRNRIAEYKRRKPRYRQQTIPSTKLEDFLTDGWELIAQKKTTSRIKKGKSFDELLENDFWCVLYLFGYYSLNVGRKFTIEIAEHNGHKTTKQIDVLALDNETVVVAECKACESRSKRSLRKELGEFASNKAAVIKAIKNKVENIDEQKFLWLFVTRYIEWSNTDKAIANEHNIKIISDTELRYFSEIAKRLGPAGRYQFHATYLANSKVGPLQNITVPAIRTKIGGWPAYFFIAPAKKLLPLSFVNHRDLRDPEAAPTYQRLIARTRLEDVAKFIKNGGYFANAIVVNFKDKSRFDRAAPETEDGTTMGTLYLPNSYKSVWIIDGQHRLYGYAELGEDNPNYRVPVIAFEQMAAEEESKLFKTINSEQRKVPPRLLDELKGEHDLNSPDRARQTRAIAARIVEQLRNSVGGPFEDRFKSADLPDEGDKILTITSITNALVSSGLIGKQTKGRNARFIQGPLANETPAKTIDVAANVLSSFFDLIRQANVIRWDAGRSGDLCTNWAVEAYIRLFGELCNYIFRETGNDPREMSELELATDIQRYLSPVTDFVRSASDIIFAEKFKVPFGSGGPVKYFYQLANLITREYPKFCPDGIEKFFADAEKEAEATADRQIRIIQERVPSFIVRKLKELYVGEKFLQRATKNQDILNSAFQKQNAVPPDEQGELQTYIDFIDFRKIVESRENWPNFSDFLNIQLPGETHSARYLKWFDEVNRLRRIPAHPYGKKYKDTDLEILTSIMQKLSVSGVIEEE